MIERYNSLRNELGHRFCNGRDPGPIVNTGDMGDRHLRGEAVTRIVTSSGNTIYYKPRDCRTTDLLGDINELLWGDRMVPHQVSGEGFAFQEEVVIKQPESDEELELYYSGLGKLAALFYALGSNDMHSHNVIPAAGGPVAVDTETVLCPRAEGVVGAGEFSVDYGEIFPEYRMSVGESMILPRFYGKGQTSPLYLPDRNAPGSFESVFLRSFAEGYRKICILKDQIVDILNRYKGTTLRYLLRSTQSYVINVWRYKLARNDEEREKVIRRLEKGLSEADIIRWKPVLEWEAKGIREGYIPYFCIKAGGRDLYGDAGDKSLIRDYLIMSPVDYARHRLDMMSEKDLAVQTSYIRASLKHIDYWEKNEKPEEKDKPAEVKALSAEEAVEEVQITLENLWNERIELSHGCCLWHTPFINGQVGSLFGIGEGFAGIALFAKACSKSPLIKDKYSDIAKNITSSCFKDMVLFAEYLLKEYPETAGERLISRRFNGGFDLSDGIKGLLWAIDELRDENPARADAVLKGFYAWGIGYDNSKIMDDFYNLISGKDISDCIEDGRSGLALKLLLNSDAVSLGQAGIILQKIRQGRMSKGVCQVYDKRRHQYFLPAFLRGNSGIAYTMLRYAELSYFSSLSSLSLRHQTAETSSS